MKRKIIINNKDYLIQPYDTKKELNLLEHIELNPDLTDEDYRICAYEFFKSLGIKVSDITDIEIILLLLKIREITIGTDLKLKVTCPFCKKNFSSNIDITNVYKNSTQENTFDKNNFLSRKEFDMLGEDTIPEDLDWDQYEIIHENLIDYYNIYNIDFNLNCPLCGEKITFSIDTVKKALTFMSEESINSLMTVIHNLTYFDHISRSDVLQMTPIERLIEMSLLKKTKEASETKQNNTLSF